MPLRKTARGNVNLSDGAPRAVHPYLSRIAPPRRSPFLRNRAVADPRLRSSARGHVSCRAQTQLLHIRNSSGSKQAPILHIMWRRWCNETGANGRRCFTSARPQRASVRAATTGSSGRQRGAVEDHGTLQGQPRYSRRRLCLPGGRRGSAHQARQVVRRSAQGKRRPSSTYRASCEHRFRAADRPSGSAA